MFRDSALPISTSKSGQTNRMNNLGRNPEVECVEMPFARE